MDIAVTTMINCLIKSLFILFVSFHTNSTTIPIVPIAIIVPIMRKSPLNRTLVGHATSTTQVRQKNVR